MSINITGANVIMPPRGLEKKFTLTYQRYLILDAYEQWAGFAYGKDWPFTKETTGIGCDYHVTCPARNLRSNHLCCLSGLLCSPFFIHTFLHSFIQL